MLEKIPNYYATDECAQISLPFSKSITIFDEDMCKTGVLCHYNLKDNSQNINKYLLDDRRHVFPYSNIPMYKGLFGRYYVNQLFEYNKHYITIIDGYIRDRYLIKDGNEILMLNRNISIPLNIRGGSYSSKNIETLLRDIEGFALFDRYGREYSSIRKYFLDLDTFINSGGGVFVLEDNNKIKIKIVRIYNDIGYDNYIYREYDFPLNDYTISELKCFCSKMKDIYEPSICSIINPNIDRKDILENRRLIRKLSKK